MENPTKMDDLGGKPHIFGNTHIYSSQFTTLHKKIIDSPTQQHCV